jgi:transposase-like protein
MESTKRCVYCGTELPVSSQLYKRKYCSVTCSNKYKLRLKKPEVQEKLWVHEPEIFKQAMGMYWSGAGSAAIARKLDISVGTMYSWVHDYGAERERAQPMIYFDKEAPHAWSLKECFRQAGNAGEWLEVLRKSYQKEVSCKNKLIQLVCGKTQGQSAARLSMIIYEKLKFDPLGGETFAFCNKCGNIITTISWNDPIYHVARYIKTHGTFIWPDEGLGVLIEIGGDEFEHLISLQKSHKNRTKIVGNA